MDKLSECVKGMGAVLSGIFSSLSNNNTLECRPTKSCAHFATKGGSILRSLMRSCQI